MSSPVSSSSLGARVLDLVLAALSHSLTSPTPVGGGRRLVSVVGGPIDPLGAAEPAALAQVLDSSSTPCSQPGRDAAPRRSPRHGGRAARPPTGVRRRRRGSARDLPKRLEVIGRLPEMPGSRRPPPSSPTHSIIVPSSWAKRRATGPDPRIGLSGSRLRRTGPSASRSARSISTGSAPRRRLRSRCSRIASSSRPMATDYSGPDTFAVRGDALTVRFLPARLATYSAASASAISPSLRPVRRRGNADAGRDSKGSLPVQTGDSQRPRSPFGHALRSHTRPPGRCAAGSAPSPHRRSVPVSPRHGSSRAAIRATCLSTTSPCGWP